MFSVVTIYGATEYTQKPSSVWVEGVHYDADLNEIVVHAHADFLIFRINKIYGIKVINKENAQDNLMRMIGSNPTIMELHKIQ